MSHKIGFWSVFALVTGSQIGSGVFMLPTSLAPYGLVGLSGWAISGVGAVMLALVFAQLCSRAPQTGGPHVYVHKAFGPLAAFFTGWTYWLISWMSTPVVITASVGYLMPLLGIHSAAAQLLLGIILLLIITAINGKGVKTAGSAEFLLTGLKILPLLIVPLVALYFFKPSHFIPFDTSTMNISSTISHTTLLTLWGFIGLESATTAAGSVENPNKTIPRAIILGTLCVAFLYFFNSLSIMGAMPGGDLMKSHAPYADVAHLLFGGNWHLAISLIAAIVCLGTLNAWMLASGQIALGLAEDGLMPQLFARKNRHGAPIWSLLISCVAIIPLLFLTQNENLNQQINAIIDFSVVSFVFVYGICCLSLLKLLWQEKSVALNQWLYGLLGLVFCCGIIFTTPLKPLIISTLFVLSGIPVYIILNQRKQLGYASAENWA